MTYVTATLLLLLGLLGSAPSQEIYRSAVADSTSWSIDPENSTVGFKVRHLGITMVRGALTEYNASVAFEPEDLHTLRVRATISVASHDTRVDQRDEHLRSAAFFTAGDYPEITFVSKEVRHVGGDTFELVGDLTIRGTTREVVLEGTFLGTVQMGAKERAGFEARTTIDRFDYGLAWNALTEAGGLIVARNVDILLELELVRDTG